MGGFSIFSPIFYKKFVLVFRLKEKRTAAYELAAMAASGDDNKFRIVAEDGYVPRKQWHICYSANTNQVFFLMPQNTNKFINYDKKV